MIVLSNTWTVKKKWHNAVRSRCRCRARIKSPKALDPYDCSVFSVGISRSSGWHSAFP